MILQAIFELVLGLFGELIGEASFEGVFAKLAGLVPLRLRYGAAWRWRARQIVADRRIAKGLYLRNG